MLCALGLLISPQVGWAVHTQSLKVPAFPHPRPGLLREAGGAEQNTYALVASRTEERRTEHCAQSLHQSAKSLTDVGEGWRGTEGHTAAGPLKGNAKSWGKRFPGNIPNPLLPELTALTH